MHNHEAARPFCSLSLAFTQFQARFSAKIEDEIWTDAYEHGHTVALGKSLDTVIVCDDIPGLLAETPTGRGLTVTMIECLVSAHINEYLPDFLYEDIEIGWYQSDKDVWSIVILVRMPRHEPTLSPS